MNEVISVILNEVKNLFLFESQISFAEFTLCEANGLRMTRARKKREAMDFIYSKPHFPLSEASPLF